jgi:orotidine-5'-phosphate decarboxylase
MRLTKKHVIIALDGIESLDRVEDLCRTLGKHVYGFKIHDLWDREGPTAASIIKLSGARRLWIDMKLHDIPATVAKRAAALARHGADMISVHASGGREMIEAACTSDAKIIAVTALTSLSTRDTKNVYGSSPELVVDMLSHIALDARCHGIVSSPHEVALLAGNPDFKNMMRITPGVRSLGADNNDQVRVGTPAAALKAGATHLVIGRQVVDADNPLQALEQIERELHEVA